MKRNLPPPAPADEPLRLTYTPTTNTLARVRRLPFPDRGPVGEQYVQELYESAESKHFAVPPGSINGEVITGTGGRYVDAPVSPLNGGTLAIEVKTYSRWRTIDGQRVQQFVPLNKEVQTTGSKGCLAHETLKKLRSKVDFSGCSAVERTRRIP